MLMLSLPRYAADMLSPADTPPCRDAAAAAAAMMLLRCRDADDATPLRYAYADADIYFMLRLRAMLLSSPCRHAIRHYEDFIDTPYYGAAVIFIPFSAVLRRHAFSILLITPYDYVFMLDTMLLPRVATMLYFTMLRFRAAAAAVVFTLLPRRFDCRFADIDAAMIHATLMMPFSPCPAIRLPLISFYVYAAIDISLFYARYAFMTYAAALLYARLFATYTMLFFFMCRHFFDADYA